MEPSFEHDLDPVSFVTVGTQGPPGQRTFFLQGAQGTTVVSLVIEKEQALALARGIESLFEQIGQRFPERMEELATPDGNMALLSPLEPVFRVTQMGIGVDDEDDRIILIAQDSEDDDARSVRFTATYGQMRALADHAEKIVEEGRPTCPLCGEPLAEDGEQHFCPRTNGHNKLPSD